TGYPRHASRGLDWFTIAQAHGWHSVGKLRDAGPRHKTETLVASPRPPAGGCAPVRRRLRVRQEADRRAARHGADHSLPGVRRRTLHFSAQSAAGAPRRERDGIIAATHVRTLAR